MKLTCFLFLIMGLYFITPVRGENFDFQKATSDLKKIMKVIRKHLSNDTSEFTYTGVENATTIHEFRKAGNELLSETQENQLLRLPRDTRNGLKEKIAKYNGEFYQLVRRAGVDSRNVNSPLTDLWRKLRDKQQED